MLQLDLLTQIDNRMVVLLVQIQWQLDPLRNFLSNRLLQRIQKYMKPLYPVRILLDVGIMQKKIVTIV